MVFWTFLDVYYNILSFLFIYYLKTTRELRLALHKDWTPVDLSQEWMASEVHKNGMDRFFKRLLSFHETLSL